MSAREIRAMFDKTGDMRFISHLDLLRLFQRACRRAGIPVAMSQGFTPRLKVSITKALKLGLEGRGEEAVFRMAGCVSPEEFAVRMNSKLPDGVKIVKAEGKEN